MAEETVVKEMLSERKIEAGKALLEALDATELRPEAAIWFYNLESNRWRLIFASKLAKTDGPRRVYEIVQSIFEELALEENSLSLTDVTVTDLDNSLIQLLLSAVKTGPGIHGVRFSRNTINGQFIEDAYIYRLNE